jgi:hypothetical protein
MGKAEREFLRRQRQPKAPDPAALMAAQRAREQSLAELARIEALIPRALAVLKAAGWPDGSMIHLYKSRDKVGWEVGYQETYMYGEPGTRSVYLLSNGKFGSSGNRPKTIREVACHRPSVEQGLEQLIAKYSRTGR